MAAKRQKTPLKMQKQAQPTLRASGPILEQPAFNLKAPDRYHEPINFEIKIKNIFLTNNYIIWEGKKVLIIMKWLGCERPRFQHTLNNKEQEKFKTS